MAFLPSVKQFCFRILIVTFFKLFSGNVAIHLRKKALSIKNVLCNGSSY